MIIPGPICPMPNRRPLSPEIERDRAGKPVFTGFHALVPTHDGSGFACRKCSKTFRWRDGALVETYATLEVMKP